MISCKKATELISRSMDEELSLTEKLQLKIHLFVCEFCEKFRVQANLLRQACRGDRSIDMASEADDRCEIAVPDGAKERARRRLKLE